MTITAAAAGPTVWTRIAEVHEARREWSDAAQAWTNAANLTQPWNPHMAKHLANRAEQARINHTAQTRRAAA